MPFSIKTSNAILNNYVKTKYMGLFSAAPSEGTNGVTFTELNGNGYARAALSLAMGNAENRAITNAEIIYFPEAEANWGTATHFGIFDAKTGGEPIIYGALDAPVTVPINYVPLFRVGQFNLTLN